MKREREPPVADVYRAAAANAERAAILDLLRAACALSPGSCCVVALNMVIADVERRGGGK